MTEKILFVEDDLDLQEIVRDFFTAKSGGTVEITCLDNGAEALCYAQSCAFDLVLLDVMLPGVDGFTICRELRRHSEVPIIFLTARQGEEDRLHGYHLGCDDYLAKPFFVSELYAKSRALLRRTKGEGRDRRLTAGRISLDPYRCTAFVDEAELNLAPKEFALLRLLLEEKGRVLSREQLLLHIWGYEAEVSDRVIDNHVKKLRRALGAAASQLKTVVKHGYRLEG